MSYKLIHDGCCFLWVEVPPYFVLGSFIGEESSYNPLEEPYLPFRSENSDELYYVPEDYNPDMATPVKFSELDDAPSLNAMSEFVGIQDNGDGSYTNYKFTPAQLVAYVAPMLRLPHLVETTGQTITISGISGKTVQSINMPNLTLTKSQFSQDGNDITYSGGEFYENDEILLFF